MKYKHMAFWHSVILAFCWCFVPLAVHVNWFLAADIVGIKNEHSPSQSM